MVNLFPDFREFLESLNSEKVRYLLLGGYAVVHYGYRRTTNELDIWIAVDPENTAKLSRVLQSFGDFDPASVPPRMFQERGKVFMFGHEPVRIDILTGPSGVEFESSYKRRQMVNWDGIQVPLISLDDLKLNKSASGRAKDLADLENLPPTWPPNGVPKKPRRH